MKSCSKCKTNKSLTEFHKQSSKRDGLQSQCKACDKANKTARYAANPEKIKACSAAYRAANPESCKASVAAWVKNNTEKVNTYNAAYRAAFSDKAKASSSAWRKANPEACNINNHNYRARERANGGKLSKGLSGRLFKLQKGKCACCGKPLGNNYHLDHIMPLALDGANEDWNIQLLRQRCNNQKHARHPIEFMQSKGFLI